MNTDLSNDAPVEARTWLWTGSEFRPAEGVPVTDRGFRYGMSVFESFPVSNGVGVFLDAHLERLRCACAVTGFVLPGGALEKCAGILTKAEDGFGRVYVTAGDGAVTGKFEECRIFVFVEKREGVPARVYHRGYDLGLNGGAHVPVFAGLKTGNYWGNLLAFREGVAARCNETLLFTPAGHLISSCMANVFVVTNGAVQTPDLSTGARAGVVREWVMRQAEVEDGRITRADLAEADEIFLTSSWLGIMPAASAGGRPLPERKVSAMLLAKYRNEVHGERE